MCIEAIGLCTTELRQNYNPAQIKMWTEQSETTLIQTP